ncbi:SRPBCC family protein [Cerasicoccus arenae]|uniref:Transcriptional regulator n=1 Tax=Cerasicoccus arenae TaxID=424488 RepID=A0A8J3GC30_9BACT|nr:SRPBCC family protein [Cerasicoccus arenae]MBK1857684.1 SRPBCC family protein [Cerasicoccus arenae]GHB91387.1 transcriptional regulator [Cerasicoccus arenae]
MPKIIVERSILINAPRGQVYATVRDFRQLPSWSPWLICEPDCQLTFAKDGRSYAWQGKVVGEGEISVVTESEGVAIDYNLSFLKPWKSTCTSRIVFANAGDMTKVTWTMYSSLPIFLFWMTKTMSAMIGMDYDRGLAMLKSVLETGDPGSKLDFIGQESFSGFDYVGIRTQCAIAEIGPYMEKDFATLMQKMGQGGGQPAGNAFAQYHKWDIVKGLVDYTLGFPVAQATTTLPDGLIAGKLPDSTVYSIRHTGAYRYLGNAWAAGMARQRAKIFASNKQIAPFETYQNDPRETAEAGLVTVAHFPVK